MDSDKKDVNNDEQHVDSLVDHYNSLNDHEKKLVYDHIRHDRHHGVVAFVQDWMTMSGVVGTASRAAGLATLFIKKVKPRQA